MRPCGAHGDAIGDECPACHAPDDDDEPVSLADRIRARLLTDEQLKTCDPPTPLIDGWLYLDSLATIYGASGSGKSFVSLDGAKTITSGRGWWHGHAVRTGPVLYIVAEGAPGVSVRTAAWDAYHGTTAPVLWDRQAINVYSPAWASALAEVVADMRPVLVVLDTFARCIVGADENSAKDIGQAIAHLDMIRQAAGSCVLLVHHSGKDRTAGARGSSALKGAMATEIEVTGDGTTITVRNTKQKDAPEAHPLDFKLVPVPEVDGGVVLEQVGARSLDELPAAVFDTLDALKAIDVPGGVSPTTWQKATSATERTFYRHRAGLVKHGHVVNVGTEKVPKYRPAEEVETDD